MSNNFERYLGEDERSKAVKGARKEVKAMASALNKMKTKMESIAKKNSLDSKMASNTLADFAEDLDEMIVNMSVIALGEM